jgi:hypothetical protein
MSRENLIKSCHYHKKFALVYKAIIQMLTSPPKELFNNFGEQDFHDFSDGDRYRIISMFMEQDRKYDETLSDTVKEIVDMFL